MSVKAKATVFGPMLALSVMALMSGRSSAKGDNHVVITIPSPNVWALDIALKARSGDNSLSKVERDLRNFDVRVVDMDEELEVRFIAHAAKGEDTSLGGRTSLGRDVVYGVRKSDGKIIYSHGFK